MKLYVIPTTEKSDLEYVYTEKYKRILSYKDDYSVNITFGEYAELIDVREETLSYGDWGIWVNEFDNIISFPFKYENEIPTNTFALITDIDTTVKLMKVVASTDKSKGLKEFDDDFLEKYVKFVSNNTTLLKEKLVEFACKVFNENYGKTDISFRDRANKLADEWVQDFYLK